MPPPPGVGPLWMGFPQPLWNPLSTSCVPQSPPAKRPDSLQPRQCVVSSARVVGRISPGEGTAYKGDSEVTGFNAPPPQSCRWEHCTFFGCTSVGCAIRR